MGKKFRQYNPKQVMALPPSLDDCLPKNYPAHFISETVGQFDLSAIYGNYREGRGQPPYDARMMVKVWFYPVAEGSVLPGGWSGRCTRTWGSGCCRATSSPTTGRCRSSGGATTGRWGTCSKTRCE